MPRRVAISNLNASTIDIINTIRDNASYQYQQQVPEVTTAIDIPKVGEIIYGTPALSNEFLNALINRIALVKVKSATFNNAFKEFKKGYLEFGEVVEEVFVNICKAREFSAEKGDAREFKRTMPDVRSAFHSINWKVQYPITIEDEQLRQAFLSVDGVQDLITRIIDAVYTSAEYDEFLLMKYLMIKAIAHGKMYPVTIGGSTDKDAGKAFRGISNKIQFMSNKYNAYGVTTATPKADQYIFMDAQYNADYDVEVLASAFNMDKAEYQGKLTLVDDWTSFDNERFEQIRAGSDMIEEVTSAELALMANVKAVLLDKEWFQVYDNLAKMTEKYVASGLYWNYFYNTWKIVSSSPFSNAIVFLANGTSASLPSTLTAEVVDKCTSEGGTILTIEAEADGQTLSPNNVIFTQTGDAVTNKVAVHKYGSYIFSPNADDVYIECSINGVPYRSASGTKLGSDDAVGTTFTLYKVEAPSLTALACEDCTFTPTFASGKYTYTGAVEASTASGALSMTVPDGCVATATYGGEAIELDATLTYSTTATDLVVTVLGGNGATVKYTVTITKASSAKATK